MVTKPEQRLITEFIEVKERLWVPPRLRNEFATDLEDKPTSRGGDEA